MAAEDGVEALRVRWNARLGGAIHVSERVRVGAGFFTDRSDRTGPTAPLEDRTDYYGGSVGVILNTPLPLPEGQRVETLQLSSLIAIRYAAGVAQLGKMRFLATEVGSDEALDVAFAGLEPAVFHELSLGLGSTIQF